MMKCSMILRRKEKPGVALPLGVKRKKTFLFVCLFLFFLFSSFKYTYFRAPDRLRRRTV